MSEVRGIKRLLERGVYERVLRRATSLRLDKVPQPDDFTLAHAPGVCVLRHFRGHLRVATRTQRPDLQLLVK